MAAIRPTAFPLRLRARDGPEAAAMEAALVAFRSVRARQRVAGFTGISPAAPAKPDDVAVRIEDVLHDLIASESQAAYLRLIERTTEGVDDDARCVDCIFGMTLLVAGLALTEENDLVNTASAARLAAGGRVHSDLGAVRRLVESVCADLPAHFSRKHLAPGSVLGDAAAAIRRLLAEDTADAVAMVPGQGMYDLLGSVFKCRDPSVIAMFRTGYMVPEQEEESQRLRAELARLLAKREHLLSRDKRVARWTLTPLASFGEKRPAQVDGDCDFLDALLHLFRTFAAPVVEPDESLLGLMYAVGRHPALLRWWLPRLFIPAEGIEFGPVHRRVIEALVASPRRFLRLNGDPPALDYRRHLRSLVHLFDGYHPPVEQASLLAALRAPESSLEHVLDLIASYLQGRVQAGDSFDVAAFSGAGVKRLIDELGSALEGAILVARFARLRTAEDAALEKLIAEEEAAAALVEVPIAAPPAELLPDEFAAETVPPAPEDASPVVFEMMPDPGGSRTRSVRLVTTRAGMIDALSEFLDAHGERIEPPRSVARAIHHYLFEMPEEVRNTWNKETLNGFPWHKLKRGRCRIYIRIVGETVCFSLINRRDWVHDDRLAHRGHGAPRGP